MKQNLEFALVTTPKMPHEKYREKRRESERKRGEAERARENSSDIFIRKKEENPKFEMSLLRR